ncbi:MAG: CoA-binding protein [Anaerolineales bacterium]|nr:CoA-binding protein [Anaerolineales bacterium]
MASLEQIQAFLGQKRLAFVGLSRQDKDFSRILFNEFQKRGYEVIPVNPNADEIAGLKCYAHVQDIEPPVENALIITPSEATEGVVQDCATAGVKRVWMHRGEGIGAVSQPALDYCQAHQIDVVDGYCPFMFFENAQWFHRLHGFVVKVTGKYPQ